MLISMEILSQMVARTDSGASKKNGDPSFSNADSPFQRLLDERRTVKDFYTESVRPIETSDTLDTSETVFTVPKEQDKEDKECTTLAAGAIVNQAMVVFILEGDKESAAETKISDTATGILEMDQTSVLDTGVDETGIYVEDALNGQETALIDASEVKTAVNKAEESEATDTAAQTGDALRSIEAETSAVVDAEDTAGKAMARTPVTRTPEQQGNEEDTSAYAQHGDLSPLENENDKASVKGPKEKTYSETADAIRNKAEGAQEHGDNVHIPLAEGIRPERFQADQHMKQAAVGAPVRPENLFDEMVARIETVQDDSKSTMTIQLKPAFLGNVALEIAIDAAGLHVKIDAADGSVRSLINGQIATLIESLENKGIAVAEVEVAYTGIDNGSFTDSREGHAQQERHSRRTYRDTGPVDSAAYYAALPFDTLEYYMEAGVSSVEYRA